MGLRVSRLIRTHYGPFQLGELAVRGVEEAPAGAVVQMKRSLARASRPPRES
jgi:16S rRNA U516 pseudouridylate synthase RsuA-like enzyme